MHVTPSSVRQHHTRRNALQSSHLLAHSGAAERKPIVTPLRPIGKKARNVVRRHSMSIAGGVLLAVIIGSALVLARGAAFLSRHMVYLQQSSVAVEAGGRRRPVEVAIASHLGERVSVHPARERSADAELRGKLSKTWAQGADGGGVDERERQLEALVLETGGHVGSRMSGGEEEHGLRNSRGEMFVTDSEIVARSPGVHQLVAAEGTCFDVELGGQSFGIVDRGTRKQLRLYDKLDSIGKRDANIVFFFQISAANIALLPRLLVVMWHPNNLYIVHLDKKIPSDKYDRLAAAVANNAKFSNIHLLEREPITYKGVSMLLNTLSAMEYALSLRQPWDFFINLSGSDYPLVNVGTMRRLLGHPQVLDRNVTFLQLSINKEFWQTMRKYRFNYIFYDTALGMKHTEHELKNTWMPHPVADDIGIDFVHAEAWIIAHRSFAAFSVRSAFARKLLILLSGMQDPEEHFFAMLAWNNKVFNDTLAHHAFRDIVWDFNGKMSGQHPYHVDEQSDDGSFPFWENHISRSRYFFARKFRNSTGPLLDRIDRLMSGTSSIADFSSVSKYVESVRSFVLCIVDKSSHSNKIRSYNVC